MKELFYYFILAIFLYFILSRVFDKFNLEQENFDPSLVPVSSIVTLAKVAQKLVNGNGTLTNPGNLQIGVGSTAPGNLTVTGNTTVNGNLIFGGTPSTGFMLDKETDYACLRAPNSAVGSAGGNRLCFHKDYGIVNFNGDHSLSLAGALTLPGTITAGGQVNCNGGAYVDGGPLHVQGPNNSNLDGPIVAGSTLTVTGLTTLNNGLVVNNSSTTINGILNVNGNITVNGTDHGISIYNFTINNGTTSIPVDRSFDSLTLGPTAQMKLQNRYIFTVVQCPADNYDRIYSPNYDFRWLSVNINFMINRKYNRDPWGTKYTIVYNGNDTISFINSENKALQITTLPTTNGQAFTKSMETYNKDETKQQFEIVHAGNVLAIKKNNYNLCNGFNWDPEYSSDNNPWERTYWFGTDTLIGDFYWSSDIQNNSRTRFKHTTDSNLDGQIYDSNANYNF